MRASLRSTCRSIGVAGCLISIINTVSCKAAQSPIAQGSDLADSGCPPLKERFTQTDLALSKPLLAVPADNDSPATFWDMQNVSWIPMSMQADGARRIAWTDSAKVLHTMKIDARDQLIDGSEIAIPGFRIRDMVAQNGGFAVLYENVGYFGLLGMDQAGNRVFNVERLISNNSRDHMHQGSVAWNGERYGTYFGISGGGHEGDAVRYVSPSGQILSGGWDWGCSHSIDERLIVDGSKFHPMCLSDAYPSPGFNYNHTSAFIASVPASPTGVTSGRLGGFAVTPNKFALAYNADRGGWHAFLALFAKTAPFAVSSTIRLGLPNSTQSRVKVARYGENQILASWFESSGGHQMFQIFQEDGTAATEAVSVPAGVYGRSDFVTHPNGDVSWIGVWGDLDHLRIQRMHYCR